MAGKRTVLTVRLRRLAAMLHEMREDAHLSKEVVSAKTGINVTTLYRIETAQARSFEDAVSEVYGAYINFEAEALSARFFQSTYVPGLLQTEAYANAVYETTMPKISEQVREQRVRARQERGRVLTKDKSDPLELWVVLDEAVIRRLVGGPEVMREQFEQLLFHTEKRNVILQILPFDAGAHPGMLGSFILLDFPDPADPELVYVEGIASDELIEGHPEVRRYGVMFDQLRAMALSPRDSMAMISQAIVDLGS
ncbi:helix-turn-helix domain-containing protein [Nocardia crassostreae]|uniref:helix-turn-helix domain-containing protein n=1 Tax=Nocardia crassostreae TaxID=53428 RepID=UPI000835A43C|nr:helix-turn-helix transcriptional regulator [Nocardia crassostreae]